MLLINFELHPKKRNILQKILTGQHFTKKGRYFKQKSKQKSEQMINLKVSFGSNTQ